MVKKYVRFCFYLFVSMYVYILFILNNFTGASPTCVVSFILSRALSLPLVPTPTAPVALHFLYNCTRWLDPCSLSLSLSLAPILVAPSLCASLPAPPAFLLLFTPLHMYTLSHLLQKCISKFLLFLCMYV